MKSSKRKKIIVSVTNDLVTDQRVHKVCTSLLTFGYEILLVGRKLPGSPDLSPRSYELKRMRLMFRSSVLFYAEYNIRLFLLLMFRSADAYLSNDLDTLPANYLAAKIKGKKLYYDSHEYYTEVPELVDRPFVKKIWESIEGKMLPHIESTYTVSETIARAYQDKYGIDMKVVRNFPRLNYQMPEETINFDVVPGKRMILYQGVVNVQRGLEEAIESMRYIDDAVLYIAGRGDIFHVLQEQVRRASLDDRVKFLGGIPFGQLPAITRKADVGLSIEKPVGLNYTYALPNKFFDYIHAGVPVIASSLPEIQKVMDRFKIGDIIKNHDPEHIAEKITELLNNQDKRVRISEGLKKAKEEYCWEREEVVLKQIFLPGKVVSSK